MDVVNAVDADHIGPRTAEHGDPGGSIFFFRREAAAAAAARADAMDPGPAMKARDAAANNDDDNEGATHSIARRAAPATSDAPKVFGINLYLVIVYLALLYLMFRTGSLF